MGLLENVSSLLGTGAGGASLAGAIYAGSIALENEMRSEAKKDIARLINTTTINPHISVTANFIFHSFETIFTSRHWSIRCLWEAHPAVPGWSICSMRVPCAGDQRRAEGTWDG